MTVPTNALNFTAMVGLLLLLQSSSSIILAFRLPSSGTRLGARSNAQQQQRKRQRHSKSSLLVILNNNNNNDEDDEEGYEIRSDTRLSATTTSTSFGAENVPLDFRPSNEYINLINQPTFNWATTENGGDLGLLLRLVVTYIAFFIIVCYPISGATYINDGYIVQKLTASNVGAMSVVFMLVLRLYSGWGYIGSRLRSKVIEYEVTGWYDGDVEEKSDTEKARDLFLYRSNVQPVEVRLRKFCYIVGSLWMASCLAFNVATSMNPIFNQYDPNMLEKLAYDDKIAGIVQSQSNGRPTYCDSRYYRAVAGAAPGTCVCHCVFVIRRSIPCDFVGVTEIHYFSSSFQVAIECGMVECHHVGAGSKRTPVCPSMHTKSL